MVTNTISNQQPDDQKLRELILYVADRCGCDDAFGATKLNKILFYSDFLAYLYLGKAITGQEYQALEHGPAPRRLLPIQGAMEAQGEALVAVKKFFNWKQKRTIALREPDLDSFSVEEVALVDELIQNY